MKQFKVQDTRRRHACRLIGQAAMLLLLSLATTATALAQDASGKAQKKKRNLFELMNKHNNKGEYPRPELPVASESLRRSGYDALGQPLNFTDRVWFPGEWEEVKAIVVTTPYTRFVPGHEDDPHYSVDPLVQGYGAQYYLEDEKTEPQFLGNGPYVSKINIDSKLGNIFLYLMDGIQKGGAEAWVRIENDTDEQIIRKALQEKGLRSDNMRFFVSGGNSFWFRDCGPICFYYGDDDKVAMLDFLYSYTRPLDDLLPSVLHRKMGIPNYITNVVWEGGNCLVDGVGGLVTSSAIYPNNEDTNGPIVWDNVNPNTISRSTKEALSTEDVKLALAEMLGQDKITVLPRLRFDGGTGHVDLYADAIDENGFLFAEMPKKYRLWSDYDVVNMNVFYMFNQDSFWGRKYYDMGRLPFPAMDDGSDFPSEKDYTDYTRTYANHTFVNNYILQPCFSPVGEDGMPTEEWDRANIEALMKCYPGYTFYCVDMRSFDSYGGSIHCVTKQIPADNPIRILHKNIHGTVSPGDLTDIPFSAIITNKSGISSAQLVYRIGEGQWNTMELTGNGNCWSGKVPVSSLTVGQPIDYYLKANSNNGKTITKPFTAAHGGYYSFTLSDTAAYDENMFDFATKPMPMNEITFKLGTSWLTEDTSTDVSSGIREITSSKTKSVDNAWYTIYGHRLNTAPSTKGIYLYQGRKVVIK